MAQTLTQGAEFHDFEKAPKFVGKYMGPMTRDQDGKAEEGKPLEDRQKKGAVMGYNFEDLDGDVAIIGNSATIEKSMSNEAVKPGVYMAFEFKGKGVNSKNQPVNRFKIDLLDDENEAKTFFAE